MKPLYESVKEDKSEADKMFEELGYKKEETKWEEDELVHYIQYISSETLIEFALDSKMINIPSIIDMQELQAINQKCKELGWLDE